MYERTTKRAMTPQDKEAFKISQKMHLETPGCVLLDSSLNIQTNVYPSNIKIIKCGDYYQVYNYSNLVKRTNKDLEPISENNLFKKKEKVTLKNNKNVEYKNLNRARLNCDRLVKANINKFKSFITLTLAENITDISLANKIFNIWRTKIKSIKKDFVYICVPEFQRRGAVHYHILSNLDIDHDTNIIIPQTNKKGCYDVKYWPYGFTSVFRTKNIKIVGYMTKYMLKEQDNRLYGRCKYMASKKGLNYPEEINVDFNNRHHVELVIKLLHEYKATYQDKYYDKFENEILFREYDLNEYEIDFETFITSYNVYYVKLLF